MSLRRRLIRDSDWDWSLERIPRVLLTNVDDVNDMRGTRTDGRGGPSAHVDGISSRPSLNRLPGPAPVPDTQPSVRGSRIYTRTACRAPWS